MQKIISELRKELRNSADPKTKEGAKRFFKEEIKVYGVPAASASRIGKEFFKKIENKNKEEVFAIAEELFRSGYSEESWIAADWVYGKRAEFKSSDIKTFERWIEEYVDNWAECDTLCNHAVGSFIEMYPQYLPRLEKWARSKNRWMRRASAVTLILPARHGLFLDEVFHLSDILLLDKDDLVQKGYGWMLKEASRQHEKEVFDYIIKNKTVMPRTALRYAIEKMQDNLRKKAMER